MDTSGALALTGATELPGGDLLVAGLKDLVAPLVVLRLSPSGSIIAQGEPAHIFGPEAPLRVRDFVASIEHH